MLDLTTRLFIGCYPTGLVYADKGEICHGDYRRLAYLNYRSLALQFVDDCPDYWRPLIEADAAQMQARRGQPFHVTTTQTIILGE